MTISPEMREAIERDVAERLTQPLPPAVALVIGAAGDAARAQQDKAA